MSSLNLTKIIGGLNSTIGTVNKVIPIYKQVTPIIKNVKSAFSTVNTLKESAKEAEIKEIKSFERPITNFKKNHPDWSFEIINKDNISQCLEAHAKWIASKDPEDEEDISEYSLEFEAVAEAFENYDALDLKGGLIKDGDEVIAFTLGEAQASGKCFVTHFEKAPGDVQGAFAIINQEFTKNCLMDYEYVNREEDLNIEGLRKAKQSYYPEILLEKCLAVYHG
jgi:hypothetical protein